MIRYRTVLVPSLLLSASLYSADIHVYNSDTSTEVVATAAPSAPTENPDLLNKYEASGFFDRPRKKKLLEDLEHHRSVYELTFFLVNDRLDQQLYGSPVSENARVFVMALQQKIAEQLAGKMGAAHEVQKKLNYTSRHALYICHICCDLELKKKKGIQLGNIWAENPSWIWPFSCERVSAEKFYTACVNCTDFYTKKSLSDLNALLEATK